MDILTEQVKQEWREQGKKSTLYLYNLFTKEQILLETTDEPLWFSNLNGFLILNLNTNCHQGKRGYTKLKNNFIQTMNTKIYLKKVKILLELY